MTHHHAENPPETGLRCRLDMTPPPGRPHPLGIIATALATAVAGLLIGWLAVHVMSVAAGLAAEPVEGKPW